MSKFFNLNSVYCKIILFAVLSGIFQATVVAQSSLKQNTLYNEIENSLYSSPQVSIEIAKYLLSQPNISETDKAKINFLISEAYSVKGDYSKATLCLFGDSKYEKYLSEKELIDIDFQKSSILTKFNLSKQSAEILTGLENRGYEIRDKSLSNYIRAIVTFAKARQLWKDRKVDEAFKILENLKKNSKNVIENDKILEIRIVTLLGNLYKEKHDFTNAKYQFEYLLKLAKNEFRADLYHQGIALISLADLYYSEKKYNEAVLFSKEALLNAQKIDNLYQMVMVTSLLNLSYLELNDTSNYKSTNSNLIQVMSQMEMRDQEALNALHNVLSKQNSDAYQKSRNNYLEGLYGILSIYIAAILIGVFFWLRISQRKQKSEEIIAYIQMTRNNYLQSKIEKSAEPKKNIILKETEEEILKKLKRFERTVKFTNKDISLAVLAGQLDTNIKYLSEIINNHYQMNFNMYINTLRINYIIEKLKNDPNFMNYKISYLAENCGFASHSSFATVFKSITGISPIKFIELLNSDKDNMLPK